MTRDKLSFAPPVHAPASPRAEDGHGVEINRVAIALPFGAPEEIGFDASALVSPFSFGPSDNQGIGIAASRVDPGSENTDPVGFAQAVPQENPAARSERYQACDAPHHP